MLRSGGGLDLDHEAVGAEHGHQLRLEDLDGHVAVVLEIVGQVDGGHPTRAELALDAVAVGEACPERVQTHTLAPARKRAEACPERSRRGAAARRGRISLMDWPPSASVPQTSSRRRPWSAVRRH